MLTCADIAHTTTDYFEGGFTFVEKVKFQLHLGMCPGCRAYIKQMKQTIETLGRLPDRPDAEAEAEIHDKVMEKFRTWSEKRRDA